MSEFALSGIVTANEINYTKVVQSKDFSVLYFYASWDESTEAGAQTTSIFQALCTRYGAAISFIKIEAEVEALLSEKYKITVVPTFITMQGLRIVSRLEGANPQELTKIVKALSEQPLPLPAQTSTATEVSKSLEERLRRMLRTSPSLLFMKGTPEAPRCGFSRKIVDILKNNNVPFASFDILTDEDVRQGLKTLSDWPTYPQYYVNAELVGGLDILTELQAQGNLKELLGLDKIDLIEPPESLETRLKALTTQAPVMIFIKGSPSSPQCGFSKTLVNILDNENISYSYFDILTDEEIRQGLKTYADWPTYPQVYANGNLIGGLDIIKEMLEQGALSPQLQL